METPAEQPSPVEEQKDNNTGPENGIAEPHKDNGIQATAPVEPATAEDPPPDAADNKSSSSSDKESSDTDTSVELSDDEAPAQLNQTVNTTDLNQEYEDELSNKPKPSVEANPVNGKPESKPEPKVTVPKTQTKTQPKLQTKAKSDTLVAPTTVNMRRSSRLI